MLQSQQAPSEPTATRRPPVGAAARLPLPRPRGPLSALLLTTLTGGPPAGWAPELSQAAEEVSGASADPLHDDDVQLTLTVLYELHHRGIEGVDDAWEWEPGLLTARRTLEVPFEAALRRRADAPTATDTSATGFARQLFAFVADDDGPALARHLARHADREQAREWLALRSLYQLREADPHTWAIPRLCGAPKSALVEIQADEYGGGRMGGTHAELFARALRGAGLDDRYGRYIDVAPVPFLAALNTMSFFGLHRRLRGAIVGHLAAYEMTSSIPSRLYGDGFRRLGYGADTTGYFDEHVEADAVHEQIAARDLAGRLAQQEPALSDDILFGAAACLAMEGDAGGHILACWKEGRSALLGPLDEPEAS